jgi:ATP-dependent DNA helicase UvrD/PcrA
MTEIILGPPGTGKTTTLLQIVEQELARGTKPERIGFVTFTRRGAEEAVTRACAKFGMERAQFPNFRTLHSLCFHRLGLRSSDVLAGKRMYDFARYARIRMNGGWSEDGTLTGFEAGDRILFMENLARIRCVTLREQFDSFDDNLSWTEVRRVAETLVRFKAREGLSDYTDMISNFVEHGESPELDVLVVDEAQDLSKLQWRMVFVLASGCRRVLVAGDDDQAIYRWAGADAEHLINLEGDARVLGRSYRVPAKIKEVALGPLSVVSHRREKEWSPKLDRRGRPVPGTVGRARRFQDTDSDGESVLVLARNSYVLREQVEPELRRRGVLYEKNGNPSIPARYLEAIRGWEALRAGKTVSVAQARQSYEYLPSMTGVRRGFKELKQFEEEETRGIEVSLTDLEAKGGLLTRAIWHEALTRLPEDDKLYLIAALQRGERTRDRPRVRVSTIHASKGGEADHVILMKEIAQRTHYEMEHGGIEDEGRVWYVGVTRAREKLTIVESTTNRSCPWL